MYAFSILNIIQNNRFKCPYECKATKAIGTYEEIKYHISFSHNKCKLCDQIFSKDEMDDHLISCPYQLKKCDICKESYFNWLSDHHMSFCQVLKCKYDGCKFQGSRKELINHYRLPSLIHQYSLQAEMG